MNRYPRLRMAACAALLLAGATASVAAGGIFEPVEIASSPAQISTTYDFEFDTTVTENVTLANGFTATYGFSAGASGDYDNRELTGPGGTTLSYQLLDSVATGTVVKDLDGQADGSALIVVTTSGGSATEPFDFIVYQGQLVPPGSYADLVTLSAYRGNDGGGGLEDTATMPISVIVNAYVSLSVVGVGGAFDAAQDTAVVDFGPLTQGTLRELDLLVRANVDYAVGVESSNAGALALVAPSDGSTVPYAFLVDGITVPLGTGQTQVASGSGPTSLAGDRYRLGFEIGDPAGATSGAYEDNVTITVTAM